ncbi:hypothetical protein KP509_03G059600 [Ceratopteris richardii]|uniref:Uncharacterized protein n=1 Tax=Ceratopteris richardii TaxID=49495 RepID=A0A8T2VBV9_CERRI|nr:hypothetical protein KP509_03G059600 [Ceratopteris richardii]
MAAISEGQYGGIRSEYSAVEDPRGLPAAAPCRGALTLPPPPMINEEVALECLGNICVYFAVFGVTFVAGGIAAIVIPILFSFVAVQKMVALMLMIGGLICFLHFVLIFGAPGTTSFFLLGSLHLSVGLWLIVYSRTRTGMAFSWTLFGWFLLHGLAKLLLAYEIQNMESWRAIEVRGVKAWPFLVAAGGAAIILGIFSITLAPTVGFDAIGTLFAVDLLVTGLSTIVVSAMAYQVASQLSTNTQALLQHM